MKCPEALFNPPLISASYHSVHQGNFNSIDPYEPEIRNNLYASIPLTGETTMFKGLPENREGGRRTRAAVNEG
jgi:actin-related protein